MVKNVHLVRGGQDATKYPLVSVWHYAGESGPESHSAEPERVWSKILNCLFSL